VLARDERVFPLPVPNFLRNVREKLGHDLLLMPGVTALVFDAAGRVLLGRRADSGAWAPLSGIPDPGEEPAVAAAREALEETGVSVVVERVSGVYASPVVKYPNGDVAQYVTIAFRCRHASGEPRVADDESLDVGFFPLDGLPAGMRAGHEAMIRDAAAPGGRAASFVAPDA
jgi:8-oxo-dGTP pyrophosphatase MutT (NUDIX family)